MNYKELFQKALQLISSPARAWEEISLEEDKRKVFTAFVYPLIGLCALSVFIGSLWTKGWDGPQSFQYAMRACCAVAVSLFAGYFLAAYLINALRVHMLGGQTDMALAQQFAGYALVVPFLLKMVIGILPDFSIIALLLQFYTVYVVWEGSVALLHVAEKMRLRFTILASLLLVLCPALVEWLFNRLTIMLA
ncbi:MAG: YIP1 family protein [Bacteroides sp.]|nr:YIP1 family protein [Bacteroides sp.]